MCRKMSDDKSSNYKPCVDNPDLSNPHLANDTAIVSVICKDIQCSKRCHNLAESAHGKSMQSIVYCIPAAMGSGAYWGGARLGCKINLGYPETRLAVTIFANSVHEGPGSFITDHFGCVKMKVADEQKQTNLLHFIKMKAPN